MQDEKLAFMKAARPVPEAHEGWVVRGQYGSGTVNGERVAGYLQENGVSPDSSIETFAAIKLLVDNERWRGTPFYIRCGKRLEKKTSEVAVCFKKPAHSMFSPSQPELMESNWLVFNLQPEEAFSLVLQAKRPGPKMCMAPVTMDFCYKQKFGGALPEAYEQLLLDAMNGDQTLFIRRDLMETSWALFSPLVDRWRNADSTARPEIYPSGSWGPDAAMRLMEQDGRRWRLLAEMALEARCPYQCPGCKARQPHS